jgi:hypothetical protein
MLDFDANLSQAPIELPLFWRQSLTPFLFVRQVALRMKLGNALVASVYETQLLSSKRDSVFLENPEIMLSSFVESGADNQSTQVINDHLGF